MCVEINDCSPKKRAESLIKYVFLMRGFININCVIIGISIARS